MSIDDLFSTGPSVINVGVDMFADDLAEQGAAVTRVNWSPPGGGRPEVIRALDALEAPAMAAKVEVANETAVQRIIDARPMLIGFDQAIDVVPGMTRTTILHAGPPISWDRMAGTMKGAVTGALVYEGLAADVEEAAELAASGDITFSPCHEHGCVGSMAGVTSASMFVHIVGNRTHGNRAYTNLSEQAAKILRMGANDQSVITRLHWMRDALGPVLREAMHHAGEIDLRLMLAQALHMGDECHNRQQRRHLPAHAGVDAAHPQDRLHHPGEDRRLRVVAGSVGGTVDEAIDSSRSMREITPAENPNVTIPALEFQGISTGIDVRKVTQTGILPVITTAIAHKDPGVGMIGAGITHPPVECFDRAIIALSDQRG